ncbi:MAG: Asp23/Gls24 family envelope stress response protein [Candidatus Scatovivens sp.]
MEENDQELELEKDIVDSKEESQIKISNETVATYAGIAVSEVSGVYGMTGTFAGLTEAISGKKNFAKGIKVDVNEGKVKIDVNIIVEYGARIPDVAFDIQTRVKKSVEAMTGLKVLEVNVNVQGVHAINEKDEEDNEEKKSEEE